MKHMVLLLLFSTNSLMQANPIVTFFFRNYPSSVTKDRIMSKMRKPHALAKRSLEGLMSHNPIAGIFSSYYGYLNVSDQNGQTSFPRKQSKGTITVVITNKITPIMMFQSTVSHWEIVPGTPAAFYLFDLKEDEETELKLWEVTKLDTPENDQIPATESLIIIAKPKNVYVPLGATLATQDANLILPTLYVQPGIQSIPNALYMLNFTFLFRPIDLLYQHEKKRYGVLVPE